MYFYCCCCSKLSDSVLGAAARRTSIFIYEICIIILIPTVYHVPDVFVFVFLWGEGNYDDEECLHLSWLFIGISKQNNGPSVKLIVDRCDP